MQTPVSRIVGIVSTLALHRKLDFISIGIGSSDSAIQIRIRSYMAAGHLPQAPLALYTEFLASGADVTEVRKVFSLGCQDIDLSAFPVEGVGLGKAQVSKHATSKFAGHFI
jgi:hypothetical protein